MTKKLLATSGLVAAVVGAAITLLTAFGVGLSSAEATAITGLVSAALALVSAWFHPSITSFGPHE